MKTLLSLALPLFLCGSSLAAIFSTDDPYTPISPSLSAVAYAKSIGLTNRQAMECVSGFFKEIEGASMLNRLTDCAFFRGGQNKDGSTNLMTWKGRRGSKWGTAVSTEAGIECGNGAGGGIRFNNLIDQSASLTLVVLLKGVSGGQLNAGVPIALHSTGGVTTAAIAITANPSAYQSYIRSNAVIDQSGGYNEGVSNPFFYTNQWLPLSVGLSYNRSGVSTGFCNGIQVWTDSGNPPIEGLTELTIGGWTTDGVTYSAHWKGLCYGWLMFNGNLNSNEMHRIERSIRWLDPNRNNVVFVGDSTTLVNLNKPAEGYAFHLLNSPGWTNRGFPFVFAQSGIQMLQMSNNWANGPAFVAPAPGGPAETSDIFIWGGINDILAGHSATSCYNNWSNLLKLASDAGFRKIHAATLAPNYGFDATQQGHRKFFNEMVINSPTLYSYLYRRDLLCANTNEPGIFFDNYHLATNGYLRVAQDIIAEGKLGLRGLGVSGTNGNPLGTFYETNRPLPTASALGPGGYWVGNSNGFLVTIYSANGLTTAMKVLAP